MLRATAGTWLNYSTTLVFQLLFAREFGAGVEASSYQLVFYLAIAASSVFINTAQAVFVPRLLLPGGELDPRVTRVLVYVVIASLGLFAIADAVAGFLAP